MTPVSPSGKDTPTGDTPASHPLHPDGKVSVLSQKDRMIKKKKTSVSFINASHASMTRAFASLRFVHLSTAETTHCVLLWGRHEGSLKPTRTEKNARENVSVRTHQSLLHRLPLLLHL